MSQCVWKDAEGWTVRLDDAGLAWRWDAKQGWVRFPKYDITEDAS